MIKIEKGQVFSDDGKLVKDLKTGVVEKRHTARKDSTPEGYAEVDEKPKYTDEQYRAKVQELIAQRYSIEDELAIQRQKESKYLEWQEYDAFCEECKIRAREELEEGGEEP